MISLEELKETASTAGERAIIEVVEQLFTAREEKLKRAIRDKVESKATPIAESIVTAAAKVYSELANNAVDTMMMGKHHVDGRMKEAWDNTIKEVTNAVLTQLDIELTPDEE